VHDVSVPAAQPDAAWLCAHQVIEPIQSRCAIVRFTRLSEEEILSRLLDVCRAEEVREAVVLFELQCVN